MNEVDRYIGQFPEEVKVILKSIRKMIRELAPAAEELMSNGMPGYKTNQKSLVYYAAFKKHIGFDPTSSGHEEFREELSAYKQENGLILFPLDRLIPYDLIKRIVQFNVADNNKNDQQLIQ